MPGAWCLVPNWWTGNPTVGADLLTLFVKLPGGGLMNCRVNKLGLILYFFKNLITKKCWEVAVTQAVERWHSVSEGRVQILGPTKAFLSSEMLSIHSHRVSGFF